MRQTQIKMNGLWCTFFVSGLLFGMIGQINSSPVTPASANFAILTTSTFYGSLNTSNPTFTRPNTFSGSNYYYQTIRVTIYTSGSYSLTSSSSIDTYGCLYNTTFDPLNPTNNLLALNDDSGGSRQFLINYNLESGRTYILVVTTDSPSVTGSYSVIATGSYSVNMREVTTVTTSTSGYIASNNPKFARPNGYSSAYYYESIRLTVYTSGLYQFLSSSGSSTDLYGCLYIGSFDPSSPWVNKLICDDDGGDNRQLQFSQDLLSSNTYILVVTTSFSYSTGSYTVSVIGPSSMSMTNTTPIFVGAFRLTTEAIVGITMGCLIFCVALASILIICVRRHRKKLIVRETVIPPQYNLSGQYRLYPSIHQYVEEEAPPPYNSCVFH